MGEANAWEPVRSDAVSCAMPISTTPLAYLISQHARRRSTWGNDNDMLLHFKVKAISSLCRESIHDGWSQVYSERLALGKSTLASIWCHRHTQ